KLRRRYRVVEAGRRAADGLAGGQRHPVTGRVVAVRRLPRQAGAVRLDHRRRAVELVVVGVRRMVLRVVDLDQVAAGVVVVVGADRQAHDRVGGRDATGHDRRLFQLDQPVQRVVDVAGADAARVEGAGDVVGRVVKGPRLRWVIAQVGRAEGVDGYGAA